MTEATETQPTEIQMLKQRAKLMGITYSNNITLEKLKEKIAAKMDGEEAELEADDAENPEQADNEEELFEAPVFTPAALDPEPAPVIAPVAEPAPVAAVPADPKRKLTKYEMEQHIRDNLYKNEMKLIRVRITNMDPKKADLPGEIFTVANRYIGTVRKFIPYGEFTDNGYHIPKCLFDQLVDRKFQNIRTVKDKKTGTPKVETTWVREFALEVLPQLTQDELDKLAAAQAASGSIPNGLE